MSASLQIWGTCPVFQLLLKIPRSFAGMSIFRFSAEFRFFFFYFPLFKKLLSAFFEKSPPPPPNFYFSFTDTATIDCSKSFGKQSTSWFAGMRFSVSGWSTRSKFGASKFENSCDHFEPVLHPTTKPSPSPPSRGGSQGCTPLYANTQHGCRCGETVLCPSNSSICTPSLSTLITSHTHTHTHTHTLSLPLIHTHTHTHTDIQGCQLLRFRPMLWSVLACYTHAKNATVTYRKIDLILFLTQRLNNPSFLHPTFPSHWVSRGRSYV